MDYLNRLKDALKALPGIGDKSAERIIYHLISDNREKALELSQSINDMIDNVKICSICGNIDQVDPCSICASSKRNNSLMIVESARDIRIFESSGKFSGRYHVLNNLINPLAGIMPDDISLDVLGRRLKDENIDEVIIALSPTTEGETTSAYIIKLFENTGVDITRIAFGVPFGSDFDYVDRYTLGKSLENRHKIK